MDPRRTLEFTGAVCRFGSTAALDGVDLVVAPGEVHALVGPNGAGKTTLLRLAAGLQRPTGGRVLVHGAPPDVTDRSFCRSVGYLPSGDRTFYLRISGYENLRFFARLQGLRPRQVRGLVEEVLETVGLADARDVPVGAYSTGMRRRLAVARVLLTRPGLLIVDEATHDLDPEGSEHVREVLRDRCRDGASLLWATQRLDEIPGFAERVTVLDHGHVRFAGSVADLLDRVEESRFVLRLRERTGAELDLEGVADATANVALVVGQRAPGEVVVRPLLGSTLGDVIGQLDRADYDVLSCSHDGSPVVHAVRRVTETPFSGVGA